MTKQQTLLAVIFSILISLIAPYLGIFCYFALLVMLEVTANDKPVTEPEVELACKQCGSKNLRGYDSEPLYSPTKEEVASGIAPIDTEAYLLVCCDDCGHKMSAVYDMTLKALN